MCQFFSFVTDIKGNRYYFNQEQRNTICKKLSYESDSHTSIADYYGFRSKEEDLLNKYEYDIIRQSLNKDTINFDEDCDVLLEWCKSLNYKKVDLSKYNTKILEIKINREYNYLIGKKVKIKIEGETSHGRAKVTNDEVGIITRIGFNPDAKSQVGLVINFPSYGLGWDGILDEVEVLD
jgi:hypothetical protein